MKHLSPTAVILVCALIDISQLNNILTLVVGERLTLEVVLTGLANKLKSSVLAAKSPWVFSYRKMAA